MCWSCKLLNWLSFGDGAVHSTSWNTYIKLCSSSNNFWTYVCFLFLWISLLISAKTINIPNGKSLRKYHRKLVTDKGIVAKIRRLFIIFANATYLFHPSIEYMFLSSLFQVSKPFVMKWQWNYQPPKKGTKIT